MKTPLTKIGRRQLSNLKQIANMAKTPQWQPIKTAPKDGNVVLLYGGGFTKVGFYDDSPQIGNYPNWRWGLTIEPTHWMPLPKPPK